MDGHYFYHYKVNSDVYEASSDIISYMKQQLKLEDYSMEELNAFFDSINYNYTETAKNSGGNVEDVTVDISILQLLVKHSVDHNTVFDLGKREFNQDIINSAATDIEVLTAVIDLMNILITGNQLVITGKHNF